MPSAPAPAVISGLADARLLRSPVLPGVELVTAPRPRGAGVRRYEPRLSTALELCVRRGGPTTPTLNGRRVELPEHGLSVLAPGTVWRSESRNAYWSLSLRGPALEAARAALALPHLTSRHLPPFVASAAGAGIEGAFLRLFDRLREEPDRLLAGEALLTFLRALAPVLGGVPERRVRSGAERAVARLRACVDDAPERPWTTAELLDCAGAGWSRHQLYRACLAEVGVAPSRYVELRRLARAQDLLRQGQMAAEAAHASGFYDAAHLSRAFRRRVGVRPGRYRRGDRAVASGSEPA